MQSIATPGVETLTYTYDANHNPTSETRTGVMAPYSWSTGASGFDDEDRLVAWTRTNGDAQAWSLSEVHDWNTFTINGVSQTRTHGPAHEILTMAGADVPAGSATLQHDVKGNLTLDERGTAMAWDFDDKLHAFTANGVTGLSDATYEYDALGRRIAKAVSQVGGGTDTTIFVHATDQVILEYTKSNSLADPDRKYAYAAYVDEPILLVDVETSSGQKFWLHTARQYNIMTTTNNSGAIEEFYTYSAYGQRATFSSTGMPSADPSARNNHKSFTGQNLDVESGLTHFRARTFDCGMGRFCQRDPAGYYDGSNLYSAYFVPTGTDPTGMAWWEYVPIVSTVGHCAFPPPFRPSFKKCAMNVQTPDCAPLGPAWPTFRDSEIIRCQNCFAAEFRAYAFSYFGAVGSDIVEMLAGAIIVNGVLKAASGAVLGAITGGVLLLDAAIDFACQMRTIMNAHRQAANMQRFFCNAELWEEIYQEHLDDQNNPQPRRRR